MFENQILEVEKEIEEIERQYKNCGFTFNHYSRETDGTHKKVLGGGSKPLYVWDWTCGKEVDTCPRCKNKWRSNSKLKSLKAKLSTLKPYQADHLKFIKEELKVLNKISMIGNFHDCLKAIDERIKELSQQKAVEDE
jgi:hypothetical protein